MSEQHNEEQQQHIVLHDFLGMKNFPDSTQNPHLRLSQPSPSSTSRGPFSSSTSDIASEKHVGNHLEGVPFYGTEISNILVGNKRSNSDSTFIGSSRDAFQMVPDSFHNSHLMKMLRNAGGGGERVRRPNDDEVLLGMQSMKPTSASQKWERSILIQHPQHGGQITPFVHQKTSNKLRDASAGPSFISQPAADEGSRTGIKAPGILNSMNTTTTALEKMSPVVLLGGSRPKHVTNVMDPESSTPQSQQGLTSGSRQMTIFYGGQAHVFDYVHPHKANVIMSLAGSNGGSWSTAFSPKSAGKLVSDSNLHSGENETGTMSNVPLPQELHGRLSITGSSSHAVGPSDRVSTPAAKDTRKQVQAADPSSEA
ncbi:PREDICTED: protein TIFY 8-like isoform X2 [Lupinus angustifolius]|uniref:protein TIFY 8-like isoform X2 n=1 Tax=Lupinus angustifolius TaxID=3871 RepID=UPI00092F3CE4|nr:PREDICTED: protein TIFY 8-like isoform X2 [Lupinus angustifolius]